MKFIVNGTSGEQLAKRMVKLAWDASRCQGLDRGSDLTEDQVFENAYTRGDYGGDKLVQGRVVADYVFGRMMKLHFRFSDNSVEWGDWVLHSDYQSFCYKYPDLKSLADAAARSLNVTITAE